MHLDKHSGNLIPSRKYSTLIHLSPKLDHIHQLFISCTIYVVMLKRFFSMIFAICLSFTNALILLNNVISPKIMVINA
ncbi:unnamed protein product, partial [Vitis vinifera]